MDKQQARNLIEETFEKPFDKGRFSGFIKNLLTRTEEASFTYQGQFIPEAYRQYISTLERIGKFNDGENRIDILVIKLQKETSLERARTMQRNFVAWYLNGSRGGEMKDAALVAFVSPDVSDWRFSLVKMDYKFEQTKTGKTKVKEEFTPARRWSFLVGANENSHTAQSRLVDILANDEHSPTLAELEQAFDIETVTKEFFIKYRELFIRTKEELDKMVTQASSLSLINTNHKQDACDTTSSLQNEFKSKGVDTVNFAKKLLGQIVFLYFLQKKGWFGVGRDAEWGTGSKHFLRELFGKKHGDYKNFFNDILEPLFYEALRIDRSHADDYYSRFNCKIPFLNGGLFDPIGSNGGYNWVHADICLPDRLFSNKNRTKEGDDGDGILDIFDRYNFTVREDEPLEKEVAIDPELLGKAYEKFNAIRPDNFEEYKKALKSGKKGEESKFNKQYGVYYTPREIVHYMCQQSLINYLHTVIQASSLRSINKNHKQDACDTASSLNSLENIYYDINETVAIRRRNLPHWDQDGKAYFVTFRLYDSIPKEAAENIRQERQQWFERNKITDTSQLEKLSRENQMEYYRLFSRRYDELLDSGHGACILADSECKKIVEEALNHFNNERYYLDNYVVMPNHVHAIVIPKKGYDLSKILHSWKSFTANAINKLLHSEGELWMHESFDHIIRSPEQLERIRKYIEDNPKVTQIFKVTQASSLREKDHKQDACDTISKEDVETLIHLGEQVSENEEIALIKKQKILEGKQKTSDYKLKLPESIRMNAVLIDQKLADITVCDPAVGSGAFPVGMMSEIVKARSVLTNFIVNQASKVTQASSLSIIKTNHKQDACDTPRTTYDFKRHCIEKSLYGVDIDPGAVEIAKLRLWLSLVVDEEDIKQIEPLPNLDYKIVCGNSLLGFPSGVLKHLETEKEIEKLKKLYFGAFDVKEKRELKAKIDENFKKLVKEAQQYSDKVGDVTFDFKVYFSEVFHHKGGFDVVIANPPYGISITKKENPQIANQYKIILKGEIETYILFYFKGLCLLQRNGYLSYITPDSWFTNRGASLFREWLTKNHSIIDVFDWYKPFEEAKDTRVHTVLLGISKNNLHIKVKQVLPSNPKIIYRNYEIPHSIISGFKKSEWRFYQTDVERRIFNKMEGISQPLEKLYYIKYGLRTGNNSEYITEKETKYPLIAGADIASLYEVKWKPKYLKKTEGLPEGYFKEYFSDKKIIIQYVRTNSLEIDARWLESAYIEGKYVPLNSLSYIYQKSADHDLKYLLGVLNSFLMNRYYRAYYTDVNVKPTYLAQLPIPTKNVKTQRDISAVVDEILSLTQSDDYFENPSKQAKVKEYEHHIDQLVYKLYGLTEDEIAIVEGK
ncbi:MAG: restriction endonuclease [Candidatus Brocadia sp. WS118]|nr:MAG: restriction endonuclease [Candidatus Brocadia sp. WS118]